MLDESELLFLVAYLFGVLVIETTKSGILKGIFSIGVCIIIFGILLIIKRNVID